MVVGAVAARTELVVIGGGPGGYAAALRAAGEGLDVTLVERDQLGGTCLNVGCIPSKALIDVAQRRWQAVSGARLGLNAQVDIDMGGVNQHLDATATRLRNGVSGLLNAAGVQVVRGTAHFARHDRISIQFGDLVSHLEFDHAIVATGSRPVTLPEFPLDGRVVDSTGALALRRIPRSVVVIGAGYIGIELGTALAKLGSAVTVIEATRRILSEVPEELARVAQRKLDTFGIRLLTETMAERPTLTGVLTSGGDEITADLVVVAVGRRPNTDTGSLDVAGVQLDDRGHCIVDAQLRASDTVWAIGDVTAGAALAHRAVAQADVAVEAILGRPTTFDPAAIPAVVFADPEIMSVGVTPASAAERGLQVTSFPHTASGRAMALDDTSGVTVLVHDDKGTVLGVHAAGPHASELAGEAALAVEMAATLDDLSLTIHAHPTMSESIFEASLAAQGRPLHLRR